MEHFGDTNGDGLIDYARGRESGLANQGWKDSQDSVFHADGRFPNGPIALIEVQGYAFLAYRAMAGFAALREDPEAARRWADRADGVRGENSRCPPRPFRRKKGWARRGIPSC